tara:strand:- start:1603 stop:2451 length:849 start_codon:yes stop_codon:yes gene_type:complete
MKFIIFSLFFLFYSFNSYAEFIYDKNFPANTHGIWSDNCNTSEYAIIIYDYGALEIWLYDDYSSIELSVSKTANINDWISYKNKENDTYPINFLKFQNGKLIQKIPPENWNGIEYAFLEDTTYKAYNLNKCNKINTELNLLFEPIISFTNSNIPKLCLSNDSKSDECFQNLIQYLDITNDYNLSSAELTRGIKTLVLFFYLSSSDDINKDTVIGSKLLSFALTPTLSELFILNYDFDNSDSLSINELEYAFTDLDGGKDLANNSFKNLNIENIINALSELFQ